MFGGPTTVLSTSPSKVKARLEGGKAFDMVPGSIGTGILPPAIAPKVGHLTQCFQEFFFYDQFLRPIAWLIVVPVQFHLVIARDEGLFCNFR